MAIDLSPSETSIPRIVQSIIAILRGASNVVGEVTLTPGTTTTVVTKATAGSAAAVNVAAGQKVHLQSQTANAAAADPTTFISAVGQGTFTITHANNAQTDRTFGWVAQG